MRVVSNSVLFTWVFCIVCRRLSRQYPGDVDGVACCPVQSRSFRRYAQPDDLPQEPHAPADTPFAHVRKETTANENATCN